MTSVDRPVSPTFSTLDRSHSYFESPLLTEERKKNKSACADFTVAPSIVKMEIFANDESFSDLILLAPVPPVALISQGVIDATTLCALTDYLEARCQVHPAKEYSAHFDVINSAIRVP